MPADEGQRIPQIAYFLRPTHLGVNIWFSRWDQGPRVGGVSYVAGAGIQVGERRGTEGAGKLG